MGIAPFRHFIESQQLDREFLFSLFRDADDMRSNPKKYSGSLERKILATIFYEPSTRTRFSFEIAMLRLGGQVVSTENAREFSSAVKGESIEDTARIVGAYADGIVIRHHEEGAVRRASEVSPAPVINGGDGKGQHPSQALLDVYTIYRERDWLDSFKIAMVGDLASGRTVRSLAYLLGKFNDVSITFVSPPHLRMGDDIKGYLKKHGVEFSESESLAETLPEMDIIYMTRIQKERMNAAEYALAKGKFVINEKTLQLIRKDARLLHPLPHVEEIDLPLEVERKDPRIAYFRQAENGLYIRMALLRSLLGGNS